MSDLSSRIDELERIGYCFDAIVHLLNPSCIFEQEQRDNLACLVGFLMERQRAAFNVIFNAISEEVRRAQ
jgi:hypothetical protein